MGGGGTKLLSGMARGKKGRAREKRQTPRYGAASKNIDVVLRMVLYHAGHWSPSYCQHNIPIKLKSPKNPTYQRGTYMQSHQLLLVTLFLLHLQ